ncbi:MAG: two-component system response regulator [Syntrophus sp. (in: bacteria)]|nr:two-component system response regulator [Syntrophus sp. (in: bacteria)]
MNTQRRILCVDDEPVNLKLLEALLVPRGYDVITAANGREALERIGEKAIDIVLLDVMMPGINGFDTCRMIKEDERYGNIPVVMITALQSRKDRIKSIEAGAEDFITKPFSAEEVLARVKMLLKMKDINDRLNGAYNNINNLTSFGEKIVKTFDPLKFDFMAKIDSIVNLVIGQNDEIAEKPRMIIVGIPSDPDRWQWNRFVCVSGKLERKPVKLDLSNELRLPAGDSTITFFSDNDLENREAGEIAAKIESAGISVSNMVCYLSGDLIVLALNYGRNVTDYDAAVLKSLVIQSLFLRSLSSQIKEVEEAFTYTLHALARAAEANDEDTGNHILRVGEYAAILSRHLGMTEEFINMIRRQAQMHDVGKIHIHPDILRKPGELALDEWESMKTHTIHGSIILGEHARLALAKEIALSHHERWDGSGYPFGLQGAQIPFPARITAIADQYDALRNPRVYKPAFEHETARRIITEGDGRTMPYHFDPQALKAFKETAAQMEEAYARLSG